MNEMTSRQRLLAAIRSEEVDHVPFSPFLAYYFDFLPEKVREKGDVAYLKEMGADPLIRGGVCAYHSHSVNCSISEHVSGGKRYHTIHTPRGDLHSEYTYAPQANTWFITRHPITGPEQIPAAIAYFEDLIITENIKGANEQVKALGEDGLQLGLLGTHLKTAYQYLLEVMVGTENLVYLTMDEPEKIAELLEVRGCGRKPGPLIGQEADNVHPRRTHKGSRALYPVRLQRRGCHPCIRIPIPYST